MNASNRKTLIQLSAVDMFGNREAHATLTAVKSANQLAFTAIVHDDQQSNAYTVCDDAGKIRTFRDADDFFAQAGALYLVPDATVVQFLNMSLVAPKPFTGDIIKKNESTVAGYTKRKASATERATKLATELQLMASDPTVPKSRKDETAAQKSAVDSLIEYLSDEIARINAILHP